MNDEWMRQEIKTSEEEEKVNGRRKDIQFEQQAVGRRQGRRRKDGRTI